MDIKSKFIDIDTMSLGSSEKFGCPNWFWEMTQKFWKEVGPSKIGNLSKCNSKKGQGSMWFGVKTGTERSTRSDKSKVNCNSQR